jgi:hypothetical protein
VGYHRNSRIDNNILREQEKEIQRETTNRTKYKHYIRTLHINNNHTINTNTSDHKQFQPLYFITLIGIIIILTIIIINIQNKENTQTTPRAKRKYKENLTENIIDKKEYKKQKLIF